MLATNGTEIIGGSERDMDIDRLIAALEKEGESIPVQAIFPVIGQMLGADWTNESTRITKRLPSCDGPKQDSLALS